MRSVELFAGAGGLAIGMAKAGFDHAAVLEWNPIACETFRANQRGHTSCIGHWPVHNIDVRAFDYGKLAEEIVVVSGGPPCQPFSMGGKHRGYQDQRDMFPEAVRAVRELRPKAFIFENVKGLMRETFAGYFEYVQLQLTYPGFVRRKGEDWKEHRTRLEKHHTTRENDAEYKVVFRLLNAANYGVPQRRERVFIVGFRADLAAAWSFPEASFSEDALLRTKWITGEYWERHRIPRRQRPQIPERLVNRVERLNRSDMVDIGKKPWLTVRDAIQGLPEPTPHGSKDFNNHILNPGARSYTGHTGSHLDEPAKTLKAGDHGVPGGENMLTRLDGSVRYFTVREAARIQTFPDEYHFCGPWTEAMRQLGNAVPVTLAESVARSVASTLRSIGKQA